MEKTNTTEGKIEGMFKAGAHFGLSKARRHPSVAPYIYGQKNKTEVFNLEKTAVLFDEAEKFMEKLGAENKVVLFVASKNEAREAIRYAGEVLDMPFCAGRWIGGSLTNFSEIKKRVNLLESLRDQSEKGELARYTKKEQLLIKREMEELEKRFSGITSLKKAPDAMVVVDSKKEYIAVAEALQKKVPILGYVSSDCDLSVIDYPVVGNDTSKESIKFFINHMVEAYLRGKKSIA
ncbi:MAG: 30S ribosomal protein S2 [Candidatus Paceibacterota bacterium]